MIKTISFFETGSFQKDYKKLKKIFLSLDEDFSVVKRNAIELFHINNIDNQSIVLIPGHPHEKFKIYKLRKFACKSLKGKGVQSGIRIIYAFRAAEQMVTLIEIYYKADQASEDKSKIKVFLKESA